MSHAELLPFGSNPLAALSTINYYRLWKRREFLLRRLRFASPPVMHFTPLPGLRAQNKNSTDILQKFIYRFYLKN
ncbi:MAG: hypothetical protein LBE12_19150 [Planctomycetaceae bacterium]|nr:hypothetical protein [Planctomycetaceae bacterium]